jgi:signal transduction histidine kinase
MQYLFTLAVATALALSLSSIVYQEARGKAVLRLEQQAQQLSIAIQQSVNAKLQVLQAFQAFYGVGQMVTQVEFKKFAVVTLIYHPDIQALQWIPLTPADGLVRREAAGRVEFGPNFHIFERDASGQNVPVTPRPFYFPVYYIEPMAGNQAAHGLDAGFLPERRAILIEAWHTGRVMASGPVRLVQEQGDQYGVLLYQPIYAQGVPPQTEAERIRSLMGFVPVVLRVGDFLGATLRDFDITGFNISLYDAESPQAVLYSAAAFDAMEANPDDFNWVGRVALADRTWLATFDVPAAAVDALIERPALPIAAVVALIAGLMLLYLHQRNRTEAALRRYAHTLEAANRELNAYSYTLAHDLKSPLALITGYAYLLDSEPLSDEGRAMLASITTVSENMAKMTDDLLQLARLRDAETSVVSVDMNAVVQQALERFENQRDHITIEGSLPPVLGHAPWLVEVFANLINNALKYTPPDRVPRITIRGRSDGAWVRYEVSDNGIGISPQDRQRIFEMFTRLPEGQQQRGLGIGLSIVQRTVERLGGRVGVDSVQGQGSTFWFTLKPPQT